MAKSFFDANNYFIDEKVGFFKFENQYKVYNEQGEMTGMIKQQLSAGAKILRLLVNKQMLPFRLNIVNQDGAVESVISRGFTFFRSKVNITDGQGMPVALIKQKFRLFKPKFEILNPSGQLLAIITGDWKAWNFTIENGNQVEIGTISKKWNGLMKEMFTSADKYIVSIHPGHQNLSNKMAIVSCAVCIDMILKESK